MCGRRGVPLRFFALVFALSVPLWGLGELAGVVGVVRPYNLPVSALMGFCPLIAALLLLPRGERLALLKRAVASFGPKRWYVPALLLMPGLAVASYVVLRLSGEAVPGPHVVLPMVPVLFVAFFVAAVGEEAGWMGYALGRMPARWSALTTALVMGVVWAVWHVVPWLQADRSVAWVAWQCLGTIATRVLIVWVYGNTGGSVCSAVLLHTSDNMAYVLFPVDGSHYDPMSSGLLATVAAVIVVFLWGPRTMARHRYASRRRTTAPSP
ncbi:CPBP family intramembrane glutamic endopeptidase [Thermopolyspora sp. NPDC052614]|uniref:CPBP family intramembrane glutamic endopeptidase n=1 Tax=Thermopolyspora sp. NPDC052614 TaxID=3155682 RepID=UPI003415E40F